MPKKEASKKAREWERERRERLNESFNLLSTLLPSYDPSVTRSKIEILQKAVVYISDLQKENRELTKSGKDQSWKQIRHLKHRVESLLRRVHQLARLLSDAGISIPPELPKDGYQPLSGRQPKWSNKFRQEDAAALLEKVKNKRTEKKKQKKSLNICGSKVNSSETKIEVVVSTVSNTSDTNTTLTTSRTRLCRVAKNKRTSKHEDKKKDIEEKDVGCEKLPTVTQLLGLSLNDIDVAPPPSLLSGGHDLSSNNFAGVTSNTPGTNVTVLASNVPQVPQRFIVIPRASSISTTSTSILPQPPCIVVAPGSQADPNNQHTHHSGIVVPSRTQATKLIKTSTAVQQPMPVILSNTTNALETIAAHPVRKLNSAVAVTNSHLLTTPIMATGLQTCPTPALLPSQGTSLTGLGPGTLILANGSILPILPPPQSASVSSGVIGPRNNTQIVMSSGSTISTPVLPNQSVILVQNKVHTTSHIFGSSNVKPRRIYSLCLPKPLKRKGLDSTKTTFVNKIPISALTSRSSLIRSSITNPQLPQNLVNKVSNKSEDSKNNKRICDRKAIRVNKKTGKTSRNNSRIDKIFDSKKSTANNITKKELQNTVHSRENVRISREPDGSKSPTVKLTSKENSIELVPIDDNATEIQVSDNEDQANISDINSVKKKLDRVNNLTINDSHNKRRRDNSEDTIIKSNKQTKYELVFEKCNSNVVDGLPTICQQSASTATLAAQDSLTCLSVDENVKKMNDDNSKVLGGIDNYSVSSLCKRKEKNVLVTDMNTVDVSCSFKEMSQRRLHEEMYTSTQGKEVIEQDRAMNNHNNNNNNNNNNNDDDNATGILCNSSKKFSSSLPCNMVSSNFNNLTCIERTSEYIRPFLIPEGDVVAIASSQDCRKSPVINHSERYMESNQNFCNMPISSGSKNTTEIKSHQLNSAACANEDNSDITAALAKSKPDQNLESSSSANSFQQRTCSEEGISLTMYPQPVKADVKFISSKEQEISPSRGHSSVVSALQENFGSECVTEIQDVITVHRIHNEPSSLISKVNRSNEESTTCESSDSKTNNLTVKDSQGAVLGISKEIGNKENGKDLQETAIIKTQRCGISGKSNVSSELTSATEYNSYSSVSESNASLCSATNKIYRNTESLDSSTSTSSSLCLTLQNNELPNDLFASLQVPSGVQHAESISPTAAFLLAFPLVSTSKVSDIIGDSQDDVESDSLQGTSTLLQIGSLDSDQHSEAIISRSPTFHNSNSTTKISSQPITCQKDSSSCRTNSQDLECPNFISSELSHKADSNSERMKAESSLKFSETRDVLQRSEKINKSWMSVHTSPCPETGSKNTSAGKDQGTSDIQSYSSKCTVSQLVKGNTTEDCAKPKTLDQICKFNVTKEMCNEEGTPENIITQQARTTNTNLQHFTVSQFVSPAYNTKENTPVSTKQNQVPQATTLHIATNRNIDFAVQTSTKSENSEFLPEYKENSDLHSSNAGTVPENVLFTVRKSGIEQGTMTDEVRFSPQPVPLETLNKTKHSSTLSYTSNDCNDYPVASQCEYVLAHSTENEKCSIPSFSVAHNSSNVNILSWTTLSPVSTMTNTSQYDGFGVQNTQAVGTSQNNCTPVPKKQINESCLSEASAVMPTVSSVSEICHSNSKQTEPVNTVVSLATHKITESFNSPVLQNNNSALANQTSLRHYFNDQRRIQTSVGQANISNAVSQPYASGKVSDNEQQHRPPVNWMTAPDIRVVQQSILPSSSGRDRALTSSSSAVSTAPMETITCKDIDFCTVGSNQNLHVNCVSTTLPTFDTRTYTSNSFYGCHSVPSQNSQSNFYQSHAQHRQVLGSGTNDNHCNKLNLTNPLNRITDVHVGQHDTNDIYPVSWMQRKSCASSVGTTETNFVSSSLPTLVGDLALGTNFPLPISDDVHTNKGLNFNVNSNEKKSSICETENNSSEGIQGKHVQTSTKNSVHSKEQNTVRSSIQEFRSSLQSLGSSFLSVSQLVDQAHSCVGSSRVQTVSRHNNHGNRVVAIPNKQSTCQSRSHDLSGISSTSEGSKKGISSLTDSNKEVNEKNHSEISQSLDSISFRTSESGVVLSHSGEEENRKTESNQIMRNSNNYMPSVTSSGTSVSHGGHIFSVGFNAQSSTSIPSSNITWPTSIDIAKQSITKTNLSTCKAPASSYSAEALIGINSPHITNRVTGPVHDSRGNKVISLPPPVVSERFCHHQNYSSSSVTRSVQVPPPFSAESILPSNYFASVELQTPSQDTGSTGHRQTVSNHQSNLTAHPHQNEQVFSNFTSASQSSVGTTAGQCNSVLYTHSDFISSVATAHSSHTLPSVSLSCNFLPDLGTNNSYTAGVLSDSGNPFIFPTTTIPVTRGSSNCHNSENDKQNISHLHTQSHSDTSSTNDSVRHNDSNQVVSSRPLVGKEVCPGDSNLRCNNGSNISRRTGTSNASTLHQNAIVVGSNCSSSKQRIRKRTSEPVASSNASSIGGLMDIGYLGMPPAIGSPILPDDGTYLNHSGAFLSSGAQHAAPSLYSGAQTPSQGSFYATSHSHGQSNTPLPMSHTNHLTINSGSFTSTQSTRGLQLNTTVSPSTANSSGTSLTNFNLSTIFPEINEKQVPNHTYSSSGLKEMGPLLGTSLPIPPLSSSAPPPSHPQSSNSTSNHTHQSATLLLPPMTNYVHRQATGEAAIRLPPPPPPPVPLHSSVTFNNILSSPASQMCRMQWR